MLYLGAATQMTGGAPSWAPEGLSIMGDFSSSVATYWGRRMGRPPLSRSTQQQVFHTDLSSLKQRFETTSGELADMPIWRDRD